MVMMEIVFKCSIFTRSFQTFYPLGKGPIIFPFSVHDTELCRFIKLCPCKRIECSDRQINGHKQENIKVVAVLPPFKKFSSGPYK